MLKFNYYLKNRVQIWLVCNAEDDYGFTELQGDEEVGESTETPDGHLDWFAYETGHGEGIDGLLDTISLDIPERLAWMALHGIAPGQPFQVEIESPTYSGPDYWGEYDWSAGDWRLMQIEPWSKTRVVRAWKKESEFLLSVSG
jgi:hypothetical protein